MASVRKRTWTTGRGDKKTAWEISYVDRDGGRHRKQFAKKSDADAERIRVEGQMMAGIHVPDRTSITVLQAAKAFLADFEDLVRVGKRERTTLEGYAQFVDLHLAPYAVAGIKLARLGGPDVKTYARGLEANLSDSLAVRSLATFRRVMKFAQGEGWIVGNPAEAVSIRTGERGAETDVDTVEIPPKDQLRRLIAAAADYDATGYASAVVQILMFGGLRASEMRGLRRRDLRLAEGEIDIRQRADRWNTIGPTKTRNSRRTIPIPPGTVRALKTWLKSAPPSEMGLVFPNGVGKPETYANIYHRFWRPLMTAAGLVAPDMADGQDAARPLFALHALRHVAVSLWIEQEVTPKKVQSWAGHATIQFTMDRYGHLWPDPASNRSIVSAIERDLLNNGGT